MLVGNRPLVRHPGATGKYNRYWQWGACSRTRPAGQAWPGRGRPQRITPTNRSQAMESPGKRPSRWSCGPADIAARRKVVPANATKATDDARSGTFTDQQQISGRGSPVASQGFFGWVGQANSPVSSRLTHDRVAAIDGNRSAGDVVGRGRGEE